MNNIWKPVALIFVATILFFLYAYMLMLSWNDGIAAAIPGLLQVDFYSACWMMLGIFLVKIALMKYPDQRQGTPE